MFFSMKYAITLIFMSLLITSKGLSQVYNTDVEAKILIKTENRLIKIMGTAFNKTEINQSLRYVLSVIKTNLENSNSSKNDQTGRFVLESGQKSELSQTTINKDDEDKVIILLLIYDLDDIIIGKDRVVFNDTLNNNDTKLKEKLSETLDIQEDVSSSTDDGIVLRGIVIEEVKTKPGRDFYAMFYSDYLMTNINGIKIVTIKEALLYVNSTIISVLVGDELVYRFLVKPQNDYLKSNSNEAIKRVRMYLERLKKNKNLVKRY